ncbi:MAG: hypothetical protein ABI741_16135 [Ferruginibacter sp.]
MMKKINWLFLVAGTFIMLYIMAITGRSLKTPATPLGILNLEFAYNSSKAHAVLEAWAPIASNGTDNIRVAIKNTWLDFIFLFFYSLFLFYACKTISESFRGFIHKLGIFLAIGALNAGFLDIGENAGMLITLNGFSTGSIALFTTICSVIKWILALPALAYLLLAGPFALYRNIKEK